MSKTKKPVGRGGARKGAGRKNDFSLKQRTLTLRVPEELRETVKQMVNELKQKHSKKK